MATSFTDKITRLANKLETYDTRIAALTDERNQVAAEMQELLTVTTGTKTLLSTVKGKTGSIGDKILNALVSEGGWTRDELASKLKMTPSRIGLSLYHLTQKNKIHVQTENDVPRYYAVVTTSPAVSRDTTD